MAPYGSNSIMDDQMDENPQEPQDREISLSPGLILGAFFALALVCAVFFGFGYSVGRRSTPLSNTIAATSASVESSSKPSSGSFLGSRKAASGATLKPEEDNPEVAQPDSDLSRPSKIVDLHKPSPASSRIADAPETAIAANAASGSSASLHPPSIVAPMPQVSKAPAGTIGPSVQVAAFSHQQDADLVAASLRKRGYDVSIRQEAQDKLLHVQLGPFATKKEADAMRQRLQADGYNAIVK